MLCCSNYLLVILLFTFYPYFVLSAFINITDEIVHDVNINTSSAFTSNYSLGFQEVHVNKSAEKCDCGFYSFNCVFENSRKVCSCFIGYLQTSPTVSGTCEECDCGVGGDSCQFNQFSEKKCTCRKGYAPFNVFRVSDGEECKRCDCGVKALSCSYILGGYKKCVCGEKSALSYEYLTNEEVCLNCDCGYNSISCRIEHNSRKCTCAKGYIEEKIIFGDNTCVKELKTNWKLATYILLGLFAVILTSLLIRIYVRRSNSEQ